ncbi:MAG: alpha-hydroxy-acid oxidizing protein [Betaproteobacteria bacterium]|nr:alpha-hydroxy-acid oxidizing protein [Betaproteobacteria bacterium]
MLALEDFEDAARRVIPRPMKGRLVVNGIFDKDDARIARESGAEGVIVSNHGGRQLDGAAAPLLRQPKTPPRVTAIRHFPPPPDSTVPSACA